MLTINHKNNKVYYNKKLIGQGKDFDEAYKIAREYAKKNNINLEYGVQVR
jgi:alkaline phosphatase